MAQKANKRRRKKVVIRVKASDMRVSEDFIQGMRDFGVSPETLKAAERRNERVSQEQAAASR
jgi:hypothetical protein